MVNPSPSRYVWATDDAVTAYAVAGCVTVVVGLPQERVLVGLGADRAMATPRGEVDTTSGLSWVSIAELASPDGEDAPACALIEDNDWQGVRPEVLSALSKRGKAASAFWNVEGMVMFGCARRGKVLANAELLEADEDEFPRSLAPLLRLVDDETGPVAVALAMVEKFTGVPVPGTPEIAAPVIAFPITKPVLGLPVTTAELIGPSLRPRQALVEPVQCASSEARWRLAHWAARGAVEAAGLDEQPGVVAMLEQYGRPGPARLAPSTVALRRTADRWSEAAEYALSVEGNHAKHDALKHWTQKYWAMEALAYTACDDDVTAALGASYCASLRFRKPSKFIARAIAVLEG